MLVSSCYDCIQEDLMDNDKVALDFTGQSGKVIIDPTEALGVAVAETQMWKVLV